MTHKLLTRLSMRGVFAALLLCIAALPVAPKTASAQFYVARYGVATVSEYNATDPAAAASPIKVTPNKVKDPKDAVVPCGTPPSSTLFQ